MRLSEHEIDRRVRQTAAAVGISEELLGKSPFELSGGEKRHGRTLPCLFAHFVPDAET